MDKERRMLLFYLSRHPKKELGAYCVGGGKIWVGFRFTKCGQKNGIERLTKKFRNLGYYNEKEISVINKAVGFYYVRTISVGEWDFSREDVSMSFVQQLRSSTFSTEVSWLFSPRAAGRPAPKKQPTGGEKKLELYFFQGRKDKRRPQKCRQKAKRQRSSPSLYFFSSFFFSRRQECFCSLAIACRLDLREWNIFFSGVKGAKRRQSVGRPREDETVNWAKRRFLSASLRLDAICMKSEALFLHLSLRVRR